MGGQGHGEQVKIKLVLIPQKNSKAPDIFLIISLDVYCVHNLMMGLIVSKNQSLVPWNRSHSYSHRLYVFVPAHGCQNQQDYQGWHEGEMGGLDVGERWYFLLVPQRSHHESL